MEVRALRLLGVPATAARRSLRDGGPCLWRGGGNVRRWARALLLSCRVSSASPTSAASGSARSGSHGETAAWATKQQRRVCGLGPRGAVGFMRLRESGSSPSGCRAAGSCLGRPLPHRSSRSTRQPCQRIKGCLRRQIGACSARNVGVRVLVSGVFGLGHLVPLLDLAGALQLAGHEVRVATNKEFHPVIAGAGLRPVSAGMSNVEMGE